MTSALLTDACTTGPLETPLVNFIRLPFFQRKTCLSCVKKVKCQGFEETFTHSKLQCSLPEVEAILLNTEFYWLQAIKKTTWC